MEAIRYYVKGAFQGVKATPEVLEQQEELVADLTAKVADLVAQGKSEEEALGVAIASLGDLSSLVSEFEPAEEAIPVVRTAEVLGNRLDLHVVAISSAIGGAVMLGSTVLGAWTGLVHPGAGFALLAVLVLGIWWVRQAYVRYQEDPRGSETRVLDYKSRFRKALSIWGIVMLVTMILNIATGTDFWFWPLWVAGGTWALAVKVEQRLVEREEFLASRAATPQAA